MSRQVIQVVYVDNPFQAKHVLKVSLPSLGRDLHSDDSGVKWDKYHFINLIRETTRMNHPQVKGELRTTTIVGGCNCNADVNATGG